MKLTLLLFLVVNGVCNISVAASCRRATWWCLGCVVVVVVVASGGCSFDDGDRDTHTCSLCDDFCRKKGLEWNSTTVVFYADGVAVSSLSAACLQQPIGLDFDRETMPGE